MKKILFLAAAVLVTTSAYVFAASSAPNPVPMPTNLEVVEATETSITIAWGPALPGEFFYIGEPKKNTVRIGWGASQDSRSAVTYTLKKDGTTVASNLQGTEYTLTGIGPKVKTFRTCVTAYNANNQASPEMCATWTHS